MKPGLPWSVEDIQEDARETAEEAARRAGLPLNEWLNTVIFQRAAEQGIGSRLPPRTRSNYQTDGYSRVHLRLDDLARRIEEITRKPAHCPPKQRQSPFGAYAEVFDGPEHRLHEPASRSPDPAHTVNTQLPPNLERAIAEYSARRRVLGGESVFAQTENVSRSGSTSAAACVTDPAQSARGLEAQLRRLTEELEALKRPTVEDTVETLRVELSDINETLKQAMPRQAVESIETQIQDLARRISDSRHDDASQNALSGIEQALGEIRDSLRTMTPAENLVAYNETIVELDRKLDLIISQGDPVALQELEHSVASLRDLSAHVASSEAVNDLAVQINRLTEKVDNLTIDISSSGEVPANFQERIEALTKALSERTRTEIAVPQRLETLVQSLSDKIENVRISDSDHVAISQLEDRIVKLMERLDVSESRLSKLDAIERGLTELLLHIEDLRADKEVRASRAEYPAVESLRQEIAQTQDSIDAIRGQFGGLVDRLATVERDVHADRGQSSASGTEAKQPATDQSQARVFESTDGTPNVPAATHEPPGPSQSLLPAASADDALRATVASLTLAIPATANQIWPSLSPTDSIAVPDRPLEPGSGPPPRIAASPTIRIALSEADLAGATPNTAAGNKSSFIAAARRAAQAAGQDQKSHAPRPSTPRMNASMPAPSRGKIGTQVKSLIVAASVLVIVAGSVHFVGHGFDFIAFDKKKAAAAPQADTTELAVPAGETDVAADTPDDAPAFSGAAQAAPSAVDSDSDATASLAVPSTTPGLLAGAPPEPPGSTSILNQAPQALPSLLAAPALIPGASASGDLTGSIARASGAAASKHQPEVRQSTGPVDSLPPGIGGPQLRSAALAGDAGAAYEVAMRFVDARGVPANLEEAARWFERAASKGLAPAQFRYASMLEKGQGVKKDLMAAQRLYIAAAAKGHAKAMHNLAVLYAEGTDGKPDYANAAQWFRKAADLGLADSQYNLGVLAARGLGTEKNIGEAYKWFALAASQGDREAMRKRDEVAAHLDARALAAARQAVKDFTPSTQPQAAITVPSPPGGWDRATSPRAKTGAVAAPISISAFNSGKL